MTAQQPLPQSPPRRRPSAWWFTVPALLFLAAAIVFGSLLWSTLRSSLGTDAEVPLDGRPHRVSVPADSERTVYVPRHTADPTCVFRDAVDGRELALSPFDGSFTRTVDRQEWRAAWRLDPGSGSIEAVCRGNGAAVQIGPPVDTGRFVGGILALILVPLALGALGVVSLVVLVVLFVARRPRTG